MATFTPNPAGIARLLTDPSGPVMRDMIRRAEAVLAQAHALLARSEHTGTLAESLQVRVADGAVGVGSDLPECVYLHNGTGPQHVTGTGGFGSVADPRAPYRPPAKDPRFAAWARDHGWNPYTFAQHVFAVGTAPNPFLRDAMGVARV
jgi:hypothetical protein